MPEKANGIMMSMLSLLLLTDNTTIVGICIAEILYENF